MSDITDLKSPFSRRNYGMLKTHLPHDFSIWIIFAVTFITLFRQYNYRDEL